MFILIPIYISIHDFCFKVCLFATWRLVLYSFVLVCDFAGSLGVIIVVMQGDFAYLYRMSAVTPISYFTAKLDGSIKYVT